LAAAVDIAVEGQVDGARGPIAQLLKLGGVHAGSQRTGDIAKSCLPQSGPIEQAFQQHDLTAVTNALPALQSTLPARKQTMWVSAAEAASVEVVIEGKDDAMGEGVEAFARNDAGLLQIAERIAQAHQPGTQTAAGRIADAHLFDY